MEEELFYIEILKIELNKRKQKNSSYSLRSFANNLEVDASHLSKILNEKIIPTLEIGSKICEKLNLNEDDSKRFMQSIADEKSCIELYKLNPDYTDCDS